MNRSNRRWIVVASLIAAILLTACQDAAPDEHVVNEPYKLEPVEGTDIARVTLTERAKERLGIETGLIARAGRRMTVPSDAVYFDVNGKEWVYTNPELLVFVRARIRVDRFDGEMAFLSDGPPAGTEVVTVGVAELVGSEFGV